METFELRKACNLLLTDLKQAGHTQNIIKLSSDVQLPDHYIGNPLLFTSHMSKICVYLSGLLINGAIHIELTSRSIQNRRVGLHVQVTGLGSSRTNSGTRNELLAILKNSHFNTSSKCNKDKIIFDFDHMLKTNTRNTDNAKPPFDKKKILIADDNEINAMVFSSFLEEWGIETLVAINGADAVLQVHDASFDAILMDIHMPILNGNLATKRIRAFDPEIPIIAITASTNEQDSREALLCGANDYLIKPVSSANLFQILSKYL